MIKIDIKDNDYKQLAGSIKYACTAGDVASISLVLDDLAEADEFAHLARVEIYDGVAKLFAGSITRATLSCAAGYSLELEISSDLALLASMPYVAPSHRPHLLDLATELRAIYEHARETGAITAGIEIDFTRDYTVLPPKGLSTCAAAVQGILSQLPHVAVLMTYAPMGDMLRITDAPAMVELDALTGVLRGVDSGAEIGRAAGTTQVELTPRHDLVHPCVSLVRGGHKSSVGAASACWAPYSHVHYLQSREAPDDEEEEEEPASAAVVQSLRQMEVVRGVLIPRPHDYGPNSMSSIGASAQVKFWRSLPKFMILKKFHDSKVNWGKLHILPMDAAEAYPEEPPDMVDPDAPPAQDGDSAPANYQLPHDWMTCALHVSGTFIAASELKNCTRGIKFCKAIVEQNIYSIKAPDGLTAAEYESLFDADGWYNGKACRMCTMRVEGVLISRQVKRYYPLTGELAEGDSDYEEPEEPEEPDGGGEPWIPYDDYVRQYYDATRALYYDGSLSLVRYQGGLDWLGCRLSLLGLAPAWTAMATPVHSLAYDLATHSLGVTLGSAETLSIDEYAARINVSMGNLADAAADALGAPPAQPDEGEPEPEPEDNGVAPIAASYSAVYSATTGQKSPPPLTVYAEGNEHFMSHGIIVTPRGAEMVPRMKIDEWSENKEYHVRMAYKAGGIYEPKIVAIKKR